LSIGHLLLDQGAVLHLQHLVGLALEDVVVGALALLVAALQAGE
jgi:hypothetical protein